MKQLYLAKFLLLMGISSQGYSQWTNNTAVNTPICMAGGAQRDPRIESDQMGGAFIAWKDNRTGVPDIYLQHVDSNGIIQWALDGIGACTDTADQSTPNLILDGLGNVIITWSDLRSGGERDVYAQKVDVNGNMLWTLNGVVVANQVEREHNERICPDGNGGCFIVFEKEISPTYQWDIWIQHLDGNGNILWPAGGLPVVTTIGNKRNPKLQRDHSGGAYITWQDKRDTAQYDIYAQHMAANGTRLWGVDGLGITNAVFDQTNPKMDPDNISGGVYIAWADDRSGAGNDIYCQRIDSMGNILWTANGVPVCTEINNQSAVDILSNSNVSGVILTWKDSRSGNSDIYAQRLDINGNPQWISNGIPVQNNSYVQINPNIAGDGAGGAVICWEESNVSLEFDIMAQRINSAGVKQWNANGTIVCNAPGNQSSAKNTSDDYGGTIVTWEDYRNGPRDIYAQHINFDGSVGIEPEEVKVEILVYPNPFNEQTTISFSSINQETSLEIYNIHGQLCRIIHHVENGQVVFQRNELSAGLYSFRLKTKDKVVGTGKLMVEK